MSIRNRKYNDNEPYTREDKQIINSNGGNKTRCYKQSEYDKNGYIDRYGNSENNVEYKGK